jgi:hypothetical protein
MRTAFQRYLSRLGACAESREWAGNRTAREAWDECERADWLLWWATKAGVDHKQIVRAACQCARRALRFVAAGEARPLHCIETVEAWCDGKATIVEVRSARPAVCAAAYAAAYAAAAAAAAAADAAYAYAGYADAAYVCAAAYAAADAAADAADAAYAADAADAAAYRKVQRDEHVALCAIVRAGLSMPEVQE